MAQDVQNDLPMPTADDNRVRIGRYRTKWDERYESSCPSPVLGRLVVISNYERLGSSLAVWLFAVAAAKAKPQAIRDARSSLNPHTFSHEYMGGAKLFLSDP